MKWYNLYLVIIFMSISCSIFDTGDSLEGSASLSSIMFNDEEVEFLPPFSPEVTEYSVIFPVYPRSFYMTVTAENSEAAIQVNGEVVESGVGLHIDTSPPNFVVEIIVTSENGENSKTYVLNILDNH
jgi:hypothetical protein